MKGLKRMWARWLDRPYPAGTVLYDHYEIVRVLGIGSYGITYLSRDQIDGNLCVVKQVKPSKKGTKQGIEAYEYETALLQKLDHPSIPGFYQKFTYQGHFFFAMEYMSGKNFEDLIFIEQVQYSERQSLLIIQQLLSIVDYLYQNGISHRDLRIPNVLMNNNHELKLIDFGLARYLIDRQEKDKGDFCELAHFLLFLLYSTYVPNGKKNRSWEEELSISRCTKSIIRRLFEIDAPYSNLRELKQDMDQALEELTIA